MATNETRAARHNGRGGKHGAYSARHNDRNFDLDTVDHIDPSLGHLNIHRRFAGDYPQAKTNEEYELAFYEDHFGASLARKNAGYKAKGKSGQIKTMEEYHRSMKSCPEETYYSAGQDVSRALLWEIYLKHQAWKAERFPQCQTLTADLHADEPGAMLHIHERSVWVSHDANGAEVVGQARALAEMGVERPDPTKATSKHNNAKQTYTQECRENFLELCREHGLEIITEAKPSGKVGLALLEYKIQHAKERAAEMEAQLADLEKNAEFQHQLAEQEAERTKRLQGDAAAAIIDLQAAKDQISGLTDEIKQFQDERTVFGRSTKELKLPELQQVAKDSQKLLQELDAVPATMTGKRRVEGGLFDRLMDFLKSLVSLLASLVSSFENLHRENIRLEDEKRQIQWDRRKAESKLDDAKLELRKKDNWLNTARRSLRNLADENSQLKAAAASTQTKLDELRQWVAGYQGGQGVLAAFDKEQARKAQEAAQKAAETRKPTAAPGTPTEATRGPQAHKEEEWGL